jgi:hypothetical protein
MFPLYPVSSFNSRRAAASGSASLSILPPKVPHVFGSFTNFERRPRRNRFVCVQYTNTV